MLKSKAKNTLTLFIGFALLFSCTQVGDRKNQSYKQKSKQFLIKNSLSKLKDTSKLKRVSPLIIQLPFGSKSFNNNHNVEASFYTKLIYKNFGKLINDGGFTSKTLNDIKLYNLPPISKVSYLKVSTEDTTLCTNHKPFQNFIKLSKYRYQLPNIADYQCYYMCNYDPSHKEYTTYIKNACNFYLYDTYGYLILYNPVKKEAKVITIFYDTFRDGSNLERYFYVDEKYKIHLVNYDQDGDDEPEGKPYIVRRTISISNDGLISIDSK